MEAPQFADDEYMGTLTITEESVRAAEFGAYLEPEQNMSVVPRGRVGGLFGALVTSVCRLDVVRSLPDTAVNDVRSARPMFDYDPGLALTLDINVA